MFEIKAFFVSELEDGRNKEGKIGSAGLVGFKIVKVRNVLGYPLDIIPPLLFGISEMLNIWTLRPMLVLPYLPRSDSSSRSRRMACGILDLRSIGMLSLAKAGANACQGGQSVSCPVVPLLHPQIFHAPNSWCLLNKMSDNW